MIALNSLFQRIEHILNSEMNPQNIFEVINIEPNLISQIHSFITSSDLTLWATILVLSNELRHFFEYVQNKKINHKFFNKIYETFIINPILKIQWYKKIREIIRNYPITDQKGCSICWSHAISTVIYLASSRIVGRTVESFSEIRQKLLQEFGSKSGQNVEKVMTKVLPKYHLHYEQVSSKGAMEAICKGRVCVSCFWLTGIQWFNFLQFYKNPLNKKRAITSKDINRKPSMDELQGFELKDNGHAVVLIDSDINTWTFMNSWGENWADNGLFHVNKNAFDVVFYDVFWYECDLTQREVAIWNERKRKAFITFYQIVDKIDSLIEKNEMEILESDDDDVDIENLMKICSDFIQIENINAIPHFDIICRIVSNYQQNHKIKITHKQVKLIELFNARMLTINDVKNQLAAMVNDYWK